MEISILLAQQIVQLFLMIFMGFLIVKAGLLKDEDSKVLSKIVLYLIIPCVILNAFQVDYTPEMVRGLLVAFAASLLMQVVLLFAVSALGRVFHLDAVEITSVYYSNSGNLIVPLVTAVLGAEWVLYNGPCSSENQPSCRSFCRRTDADSDCFSRRHHAICLYSYTDVSGIRKRFTLCQCHQCCYHAGFYCDDAAYGNAASDGNLITINKKRCPASPSREALTAFSITQLVPFSLQTQIHNDGSDLSECPVPTTRHRNFSPESVSKRTGRYPAEMSPRPVHAP